MVQEYDYKGHDLEQELLHSSIVSRILSLTYTLLTLYNLSLVRDPASCALL